MRFRYLIMISGNYNEKNIPNFLVFLQISNVHFDSFPKSAKLLKTGKFVSLFHLLFKRKKVKTC